MKLSLFLQTQPLLLISCRAAKRVKSISRQRTDRSIHNPTDRYLLIAPRVFCNDDCFSEPSFPPQLLELNFRPRQRHRNDSPSSSYEPAPRSSRSVAKIVQPSHAHTPPNPLFIGEILVDECTQERKLLSQTQEHPRSILTYVRDMHTAALSRPTLLAHPSQLLCRFEFHRSHVTACPSFLLLCTEIKSTHTEI